MKISNAVKKLEKAGYIVTSNKTSYHAELEGVTITFHETGIDSGNCSNFTYMSESSCASTIFSTLKSAMS